MADFVRRLLVKITVLWDVTPTVVEVTLLLAVCQSVCLGVEPRCVACYQMFVFVKIVAVMSLHRVLSDERTCL